jgi:isocitrate lyase
VNQFTARPFLLETAAATTVATLSSAPGLFGNTELNRLLVEAGPVVLSLDGSCHVTHRTGRCSHSVLLPLDRVVHKLELASQASIANGAPLSIFASTGARDAVALTTDSDPRDRRYLSGTLNADHEQVYCGGLDAAIARAKILARYAAVVCLKTSRIDLEEGRRFAAEVHASFPSKQLGFEFAPRPDSEPCNEITHAQLQSQLQSLGYDYYFVTQFGATFFPFTTPRGSWALFDDAAPASPSASTVKIDSRFHYRRPHQSRRSYDSRRAAGSHR